MLHFRVGVSARIIKFTWFKLFKKQTLIALKEY